MEKKEFRSRIDVACVLHLSAFIRVTRTLKIFRVGRVAGLRVHATDGKRTAHGKRAQASREAKMQQTEKKGEEEGKIVQSRQENAVPQRGVLARCAGGG